MSAPPPQSSSADATAPLLQRAAGGYQSTISSQVIRLCCKTASVVVLARIVSPADHGRFAMAASVFFIFNLFRDLGLGTAATQARELSNEQFATLFWSHLGLGVLLCAAMLASAPLAARFYATEGVTPLLAGMSGSFLFIGAGGFARSLLARETRFTEINRLENWAAVIGTAAMIGTGAAGGGAFSFVAFQLVSEAVATLLAWHTLKWRPRGRPVWASLHGLLSNSAGVTAHEALTCALSQIDAIAVGRLFGPQPLGFYNRANQMLALPNLHLASPLARVGFATLARLNDNPESFRKHARETLKAIAYLILLLYGACVAMPEEIIHLLLGSQWPEAAPLVRVLAVGLAASTVTSFGYSVNMALGRAKRLIVPALIALPLTGVAIWLGSRYGTLGIAAAVSAANILLALPRLWWVLRDLDAGAAFYLRALARPAVVALAAVVAMAASRELAASCHWLLRLVIGLGACGVTLGLLAALWPGFRTEVKTVVAYLPVPTARRTKGIP